MDELDKLGDIPGVHIGPLEVPQELVEVVEVMAGTCRLCLLPIPEWQRDERKRPDFITRLLARGMLQPDEDLCEACIAGRRTVEERCDMVEARAKHETPSSKGDWTVLRAKVLETLTEAQIGATSRDYKLVGQYTEGLLAGMRMMGPWRDPEYPFEAWLKGIADGQVAIWGD